VSGAAADPGSAHLGLHTDLYELRMAQACLRTGMTAPATCSLFIRPDRLRPWFVAAGIDLALDVIGRFRFDDGALAYLREQGLAADLLDWCADLRPAGEVWAVPDGAVVLGDEPILEVTAPLPLALLWETAIMNVVHRSTLVATKAARVRIAAGARAVADFGFRRAHGLETGVEAARAAYLGGIDATSNVEAGRRYGVPVTGTMAHALVQAFGDEEAAFAAFVEEHPDASTLLVDTYDTLEGVRRAIAVGRVLREEGHDLLGVRLDSGDLDELARGTRALLDEAGFQGTRIVASGGVDELAIAELVAAGAPIDAFGVGTSLVTSRDRPAVDIVYKLVEYDGAPRAKYSEGKVLLPGAKQVHRSAGADTDVLATRGEPPSAGRALLAPVWRDGEVLRPFDLEGARARARDDVAALPEGWRRLEPMDPPRPRISEALERCREEAATRERPR
jgi:nicotinate phosphoribosyltransferase